MLGEPDELAGARRVAAAEILLLRERDDVGAVGRKAGV
jgi:hypothetical protein